MSTIARTIQPQRTAVAVLALWFLLALGGSLLGVFSATLSDIPIPLGLAAGLPVGLFTIAYARSVEVQRFVLALDLRQVVLAQTWRVVGIIFVILYAYGLLPGVFALPAGWGDFAIGMTAPLFVSWLLWRGAVPLAAFVAWNLLGILDLVVAVTLGALASSARFGILAEPVTTVIMGQFPLSLIPTFLVPLFIILHLIALIHSRRLAGAGARLA